MVIYTFSQLSCGIKLQYTPLMVIYTFSQLRCGIKLQYTLLMVIYTFSKLSVVFFWFNDLMLQMATAPINNVVSFKWFTNTSVIKSISSYVSPLSFQEKSRQRSKLVIQSQSTICNNAIDKNGWRCVQFRNEQTNKQNKKTNTKQAAISSIYLTRISCQLNLTVTI
jgi:hypothetical protein